MFRGPLRILFAALWVFLTISPLWAAGPAATTPDNQLADGVWTVQGRAIQGTRRCGDWLVRLTNTGADCPVSSHLRAPAYRSKI